jgi:hypothetical protein
MAVFPFGLVVGFTITALPFLLTNLGIPLYQVAGVSATVMSPTFWGFLLQPTDCCLNGNELSFDLERRNRRSLHYATLRSR